MTREPTFLRRGRLFLALALASCSACSVLFPLDYTAAPRDAARDAADVVALEVSADDARVTEPDVTVTDVTVTDVADVTDVTVTEVTVTDVTVADVTVADVTPDRPAGDASRCPAGTTSCGLECLDLTSNPFNCGACGTVCAVANGTPACVSGRCAVGACNPGFADCDRTTANGCEINITSDVLRCGTCTTACSTRGGTPICAMGRCSVRCDARHADCNGAADDGCEIETQGDINHCGACGQVCARANATATCAAGVCVFGTCNPGFASCDTSLTNGCEVNTRSDNDHCGACRTPCVGGNICTNGACARTCGVGQVVCAGRCVTLATDVNHCGACGVVCPPRANMVASCRGSTCQYACAPGFADCDAVASNGCEANLTADPLHCGACGTTCRFANATAACAGSACVLGACADGFANCNGTPTDGCEADLRSSLDHCRGCGLACAFANASASCSAGACVMGACNRGFGNCDGNPANGCETPLATTSVHCGACGTVCLGVCSGGVCSVESDCGHPDRPCCIGTIQCALSVCVAGECSSACGAMGLECCAGSVPCGPGLACTDSRCLPCGNLTQPCCGPVTGGICYAGACNLTTRRCN